MICVITLKLYVFKIICMCVQEMTHVMTLIRFMHVRIVVTTAMSGKRNKLLCGKVVRVGGVKDE